MTYKTSLMQIHANRTKATGLVSITIINSTAATGYIYAINIASMTQAYLFNVDLTTKDTATAPAPLTYAFNASYGPISGTVKVSFAFNPSVNDVSSLIASGSTGFVILTSSHPNGELGAWIPLQLGYALTSTSASNKNQCELDFLSCEKFVTQFHECPRRICSLGSKTVPLCKKISSAYLSTCDVLCVCVNSG